jgi:hypothetical protein
MLLKRFAIFGSLIHEQIKDGQLHGTATKFVRFKILKSKIIQFINKSCSMRS